MSQRLNAKPRAVRLGPRSRSLCSNTDPFRLSNVCNCPISRSLHYVKLSLRKAVDRARRHEAARLAGALSAPCHSPLSPTVLLLHSSPTTPGTPSVHPARPPRQEAVEDKNGVNPEVGPVAARGVDPATARAAVLAPKGPSAATRVAENP